MNIFLPSVQPHDRPGWRHGIDSALNRLGPSWAYSPLRRTSQVFFLALFLYLFFYVAWPYGDVFSGTVLADKEHIPVEVFLWVDPLVGLSAAIAARHWNVALLGMACILGVCILFPRGFCGYVCPLGTLIDGCDWLAGKHISRWNVQRRGPWTYLAYSLLSAVLIASVCGILLSGYVAPIPILTRGLMFTAGQVQFGLLRGWSELAPVDWTFHLSIALFAVVFLLGLLGKRFWCRCVCPSGALFSLASVFRVYERQVDETCLQCGECARVCPMDAIAANHATRFLDCSFCQTCGGVCPTGSIGFARRSREKCPAQKRLSEDLAPSMSRRAFAISILGGFVAAALIRWDAARRGSSGAKLLRPPGSVPEDQFLDLCIRCGECFKVCPGPVLQPAGLEAGVDALWTPVPVFSHAACHPECNFCTQICPTRAIRPLALEEKKNTHMGLGVIDTTVCLPHTGERNCELCFDECAAAGYNAIEMRRIELDLGEIPPGTFSELELEEMRYISAPFVKRDACVGCGLCEYRCHTSLVEQQGVLAKTAIAVVAENEDRRI